MSIHFCFKVSLTHYVLLDPALFTRKRQTPERSSGSKFLLAAHLTGPNNAHLLAILGALLLFLVGCVA